MIMKKIGAIVLSIAMIFSMMPFVASSGFSYATSKAKLQLEIVKAYDNGDEKGYQALSLDEIRTISAGEKFLLGVKAIDFSNIPELGSGGEHLAHLSFGLLYDAKAFKVEPNSRSTAKATRGQLDPTKARNNISERVYNVSSTWAFELEEDGGEWYENEYYTVGAADYDDATNFYNSRGIAGKSTEHNFYVEVDSDAYFNGGSSSGTWDGTTDEYVAVIEFTANSIPSDGVLNAIDFVIDREEDTSGENTLQTENGFYQKAGGYATDILTVLDYVRNASQLEPEDPSAKRLDGTGVLSGQTTVGSNLTATFTLTGDIPQNVTITWYRKVMDKDDVLLEVSGVSPKTVSVSSNTASSSYIISAADLAANTDPDGYVRLYAVATSPDKDGNDKLLYRGEIVSVISDDVEQGKEITAGNITVSPNTGLYYGSTLTADGSVTAVSEGELPQQSKLIYTWRYSDDAASSLQSGSEKTYTLTAEDVAHCIENESGIICVLSAEGFSGSVESAATETPQRIALTAPTSVATLTANSVPNNIPTLREGATASELVKNLVYLPLNSTRVLLHSHSVHYFNPGQSLELNPGCYPYRKNSHPFGQESFRK